MKIGTRNPNQQKISQWVNKHGQEKASSESFAEATSFGELIVIAT
jgi:hypothetical protein